MLFSCSAESKKVGSSESLQTSEVTSQITSDITSQVTSEIIETSAETSKEESVTSEETSVVTSEISSISEESSYSIEESSSEATSVIEESSVQTSEVTSTLEETSEESLESSSEITSEVLSSSSIESSSISSESSSHQEDEMNPLNEPYIARQYYLNHIGDIYSTWETYRGRGITIAVIDIGFNPYHEDFTFADGTSKVRPESAYFFTNKVSGKWVTDKKVGINEVVIEEESHGTFCAGIAAAGLNNVGVVGIAPEASLLLLKTDLKPKSICAAFEYAADNGAKVITISIGSYYDYRGDLASDGSDLGTVFDSSVNYCVNKGVAVISAGGNGGLDGRETEYTFPGAVDNVIGVGGLAANKSDEIWEGSSYNSSPKYQFIDCLAPAEGMFGCCNYGGKKYDSGWNGTSFASPIVAGIAALYFEKNPSATVAQFTQDLFASCHTITTSKIAKSNQLGAGRVDVGKLLGTTYSGSIKVSCKANYTNLYCYCWNSVSGTQQSAWPGTKLTKSGDYYKGNFDASKYDLVIFTAGKSGPQTVDLGLTSFKFNHKYSLDTVVTEFGVKIGKYVA